MKILGSELHSFSDSTTIHSLIGFCHWQREDFASAATNYGKLAQLNPTNNAYKLHHAHCLYRTEQYYDAIRVSFGVQSPSLKGEAQLLQGAIHFARRTRSPRSRL
jgi:tetratricopeptide repeat protein 30